MVYWAIRPPCCVCRYSQSLSLWKRGLALRAQMYTPRICRNICNLRYRRMFWPDRCAILLLPQVCFSEDHCNASAIRLLCLNLYFAYASFWNKLDLVPAPRDCKYQAAYFGLVLYRKVTQSQVLWDFFVVLFLKGLAHLSVRCNFQCGIIQFSTVH